MWERTGWVSRSLRSFKKNNNKKNPTKLQFRAQVADRDSFIWLEVANSPQKTPLTGDFSLSFFFFFPPFRVLHFSYRTRRLRAADCQWERRSATRAARHGSLPSFLPFPPFRPSFLSQPFTIKKKMKRRRRSGRRRRKKKRKKKKNLTRHRAATCVDLVPPRPAATPDGSRLQANVCGLKTWSGATQSREWIAVKRFLRLHLNIEL